MTNEIELLAKVSAEEVYGPDMDAMLREMADSDWHVEFPSDIVVVGHDGEYADMSNPTGALYGERFYIRAEDEAGHRRVWGGLYETAELAEAAYLMFAPPVEFWEETSPCYGSEAWSSENEAELREWEADIAEGNSVYSDDFVVGIGPEMV